MAITFKTLNGTSAAELVNPFYAAQGWANSKARYDDVFALAFDGEKLVGSVRRCFENGVYMLRTMMVHEDYRDQNIGRRLLGFFETELLHNIDAEIHCTPFGHLTAFYSIIGFQCVDIEDGPEFIKSRIKTYNEEGRNCIYMRRPKA